MVTVVAASREARKTSSATIEAYATMQKYNSGFFHGRSLLVDLLACKTCARGCLLLVLAQGQGHLKMQMVGDFDMERRHLGKRT